MKFFLKKPVWARKILNYLWMAILISSFAVLVNLFFTRTDKFEYLSKLLIVPTIKLAIILIITEISAVKFEKYREYIIIFCPILMTYVLITTHRGVEGIINLILVLPLFIASFSIDIKKILFSYFTILILFFHLALFDPNFQFENTEIISFLFITFSAFFLSVQLSNRFNAIVKDLRRSTENEEKLFYKNISLEKLSKIDIATDLYNHKTFHEFLEDLVNQSKKTDFNIHLAVLDLDNFKRVNDTFGHSAGDKVIKKMADIILEEIKYNDFPARYGGEEFAVILTEKSDREVYLIVESIRTKLKNFEFDYLDNSSITTSIGVSKIKIDDTKDDLFKRADKYLYEAKNSGKDQLYSDDLFNP